ncbi:M1 family metallopeptidase [Aquirufa salirivi]|uniref:M1 family metallopeptidase n=1 Tax=Aquirufa salirivi TaxID=3104729 RepID=A0ABW8RVL2_9BACT
MKPKSIFLLFSLLFSFSLSAQKFSHADSLRGSLRPARTSYDVLHYDLKVKVDPEKTYITGSNSIQFVVKEKTKQIQVDLFQNLSIDQIVFENKALTYRRDGNAIFIDFPRTLLVKQKHQILISYQGQPRKAVRPPWDGGFSWTKDPAGKPWVTVSCEGLGASAWWPCKDHPGDEPESMDIRIEAPKGLLAVSNGNLVASTSTAFGTEYHWKVQYPINTYNVSINIADYAHWSEKMVQLNGKPLDLDYYVLQSNAEIAKKHFQQSQEMLRIFEKYFGPYPFPKDGYALVETDYWGMEHQSAVAYGNHYKNNNYGFDFIIVHESAHEWFGNSISCSDHADLWIHEALGTYAEAIYLEEKSGKEQAQSYLNGQKNNIKNRFSIIGPYGVNYQSPDADMYFKGTWMFHTLRSIVADDKLWFSTIKDFCLTFYHKNTNAEEVLNFFEKKLKRNVKAIMSLYLHRADIPTLVYQLKESNGAFTLRYKWKNVPNEIDLPIEIKHSQGLGERIHPTDTWQQIKLTEAPQWDFEHFLFQVEKQI